MADRKSIVHVKFRLRDSLLKRIEKAAKSADRSVNEEVELRLEQSFEKEDRKAMMREIALEAAREATAGFNMPPLETSLFQTVHKQKPNDDEGDKS